MVRYIVYDMEKKVIEFNSDIGNSKERILLELEEEAKLNDALISILSRYVKKEKELVEE